VTSGIVDAHVHLPRPLRRASEVDGLAPTMAAMIAQAEKAGIERQVVLALEHGLEAAAALHELISRFPNKLFAFMRGSFIDPDAPAMLEHCVRDWGFKGLKLHEESRFPLLGVLGGHAMYLKAAELGVPVLIHSWHEEEGLVETLPHTHTSYYPASLIAELGRRYPQTTFILAHAGGMWVKAFQAARPYPNLNFDVSGFDPERGIVEKAVELLGAERVLWGSDVPGRSYVAQLAKVRHADIGEREKRLILAENAIRLMGLPDWALT
jgi:predicted TIM-barrel fold metal-dependent hydrolase